MATSSGFKILMAIVIIFAVWHFGAPYLGIPSWTTYISDYTTEETPVEIYYSFALYDRLTLQEVSMDSIENYDHSWGTALNDVWNNRVEDDFTDDTLGWNIGETVDVVNYEIVVTTNAPASLFAPQYHIAITGSENPYAFWSGGYQYIPHDFKSWTINQGTGEKEFRYQLDPETAVVSHTLGEWTYYRITITNYDNIVVWSDNMFIW